MQLGSLSLRSRYLTASGPGAMLAMRPNRRKTSWLVKGARRSCSVLGSSGGTVSGFDGGGVFGAPGCSEVLIQCG